MQLPDPEAEGVAYVVLGSKSEIQAGEVAPAFELLSQFLKEPMCRAFRQRVLFAIDGYNDDPRDLWVISEVRLWMQELDRQWPYWFFFSTTDYPDSILLAMNCVCPYTKLKQGFLVDYADIQRFMLQKFAAMNHISKWIGDTQEVNNAMSRKIKAFFQRHVPISNHPA